MEQTQLYTVALTVKVAPADRLQIEFTVDAAEYARLTRPQMAFTEPAAGGSCPRFLVRAVDGEFFAVREDLLESISIRPQRESSERDTRPRGYLAGEGPVDLANLPRGGSVMPGR